MRTTSPIAGLFAKSPFKGLKAHIGVVTECVEGMVPLFEALALEDRDRIAELKDTIFSLEERADEIKNDIRSHLPRTLFLPVDRRDLLDLLHSQDSIADTAQDIVGLLVLRGMTVPPFMKDNLGAFVQLNVDAVRKCDEIVNMLDELLESSFRGREAGRVIDMVDELAEIEEEGDKLGMTLVGDIFAREDEMGPLDVIYWERLIEMLGDLADHAQKAGDRLRLLMAR